MTTLEPGDSVVLTQGLRSRPFSTAFLASSAAPIITCGLEVLVQEVMAATATCPWSSSNSWPSITTLVGLLGRPETLAAGAWAGTSSAWVVVGSGLVDGESDAGKLSFEPSSAPGSLSTSSST